MKLLFSIICIVLYSASFAQYDKIWIFGQSRYDSTQENQLAGLDFNVSPPKAFTFPFERVGRVNSFGETTASITDEFGQLCFATDGYHIWDRNGKLMPNGRGVNFNIRDTMSNIGAFVGSASQGSLIVKVPCEEYLYYVFAVGSQEVREFGTVYYSLVDMRLNNGLGDVVPGKKSLVLNEGYTEHMTVVQGYGNYLWLVLLSRENPGVKIHAYKINVGGIDTIPVTSPSTNIPYYGGVGWLISNNKANKLALASINENIHLLDFDNSKGEVSRVHQIANSNGAYGTCFSPNDSLLYTNSGTIIQYEIYNNYTPHIIAREGRSAILEGPDNRLYFRGDFLTSNSLHAINYPNRIAEACELELNVASYIEPVRPYLGLPNTIGVFKSPKRITNVVHHYIEEFTCGNTVLLNTTDTIPDKATIWSTEKFGDTIHVNKSGVYVANTFSTSVCWEHIDSYFVTILQPRFDFNVQASCPKMQNGKVKLLISGIDSSAIQSITWYNQTRDQVLGQGNTLEELKGGVYWAHIIYSYPNCDTILQIAIPELIIDSVSFTSDSLVCVSSTIEVTNTSSDAYSSFWWYKDSSFISTDKDISLALTDTGITQLMLIGQRESCWDTLVKSIQVDPIVAIKFDINPKEICAGEKTDIQADNHYTIESYAWQTGKHQFSKHSSAYAIAMDEPGEYAIKLTTTFRVCPDTSYQLIIKVHESPKVYLGNDSTLCYQGNIITLQNLINSPTNTNYLWSTGDTTRTLQVRVPGIYSLTLTENSLGCTGHGSVEIDKDCFVDIPNAFTPNGDGVNDYFFPRKWLSRGVEEFHLQIFNRWGQLIYETHQSDGLGWDGKWNGQDQPMGVYVYRITVSFKNEKQEYYEGNLTLVR